MRSTQPFLTTHTGSLPRPADLIRMMFAKEEGVPVDPTALDARIRTAVADVVGKQVDAGVDLVNDGEMSKPSYATYVKDRLSGFGGQSHPLQYRDLVDFPEMAARVFGDPGHARARVPAEQARVHLCWGNYEGPHHHDVPLADIIDVVFTARPSGISFEASNPRHAHEWKVFEHVKLPDGKVLIPGVLDSTTNFIEHPDLVAERVGRYARLVGRENVVAGTDCGFGTWVGQAAVVPDIVWAKLASLAEGARRATAEFW